jgi:uncharacterized protein YndB with AHSA1/START domain
MAEHESKVSVTRVFGASRQRVFAAWTEARQLERWFCPSGFSVHSCESDPRPGGVFRFCLRSRQGRDFWVRGSYREIAPPERLVIECTAHDEHDKPAVQEVISVTLSDEGGATRLTLLATASGAGPTAAAMVAGMPKGWNQTVQHLDEHLGSERERKP